YRPSHCMIWTCRSLKRSGSGRSRPAEPILPGRPIHAAGRKEWCGGRCGLTALGPQREEAGPVALRQADLDARVEPIVLLAQHLAMRVQPGDQLAVLRGDADGADLAAPAQCLGGGGEQAI